ncbi:MAG: TIGR02217 family protein [Sphingomonas taxi]|uniref:TIGR02217 family protein n=1 Tax=Sphingomonas taxi TaxID=1549858 RepID=A0A2W5PGA5_9SPHN|nr:MAG: TIGR02217 family protein [Sphingomonas taxi]
MGHWLASARAQQATGVLTRFDPAYWTVNFPRPMMAAVTTTAPDALRVDAVFYRRDDLAGLIWESADRHDHPLLGYETARDYRACRLSFRWRSAGVLALDAVNGPVLTIEGRDAAGAPRAWYVRLWNYATGTPTDARVVLDFATVRGGFLLPDEADAVWAGDVDRMFVSLVAPGYDKAGGDLATPVEAWVELTDIACDGAGAVIAIGDAVLPEHDLRIAGGYDDSYHLTPARLLRNMLQLGYRGGIVHYLGMSHYFRLAAGIVTLAGGALNVACAAWHADFARRAAALGYHVIWSLSYELFDAHCPAAWKQRAADGSPALTGWVPPSTLLSPTHPDAMAYLHAVARAFVAIGSAAGLPPHFQIGEPWWWVTPAGAQPCLYDASAVASLSPAAIPTIRAPLDASQRATLDRAGAALAASTAALVAAVKAERPDCRTYLLAYLPTVLDAAAPEAKRMNMPLGWAAPAFDVLQLEDYDWVTEGDTASSARGAAAATLRLGYPLGSQEYFSGFVLQAEQRAQWRAIVAAAGAARRRGVPRVYLWALPQVLRDGLVYWQEDDDVDAFDDVMFPLALGREAEVTPTFSTGVTTSAGGRETRSVGWAEARTRYDVGPGVRSEADMVTLLAFFRARQGPARGFRLRDPFDWRGVDEPLGSGDGTTRVFPLVRRYGAATRRITRPVAGSVRVMVAGVATQAFTLAGGGVVTLDVAPAPGAAVSASFDFDVPVRFAEDQLSVARATHLAGSAPSVPLIEVREA